MSTSSREHINITLNGSTKLQDEFVVTLYNKFISKISTKVINDYSELNPILFSIIGKIMAEYKKINKVGLHLKQFLHQ